MEFRSKLYDNIQIRIMILHKHHYFYLFVFFTFFGITSVDLFSDGMFLDGITYADISKNLANGEGSFWKPHYTKGLFNEFYEHPPLAFGLQSLTFMLLGDSIFTERIYSLFTFIIVGYLIVLIWKEITNNYKNGWIPLFLWISMSIVPWAAANNILENTMSIFVCMAFLFYWKSLKQYRFIWLISSGVCLSLGLLTKGFFCLYIWGVPFFIWFFLRKKSFSQMTIDTIVLISASVIPLALLYFCIPDAQHNMTTYFNKQVIGSVQNIKTVESRLEILYKFAQNAIIPITISALFILSSSIKKYETENRSKNLKGFLMFLAIVLSGIIPMMISMKQSGFYILTVYPLFAIGLAYFINPIVEPIIQNFKTNSKKIQIFKKITIVIIIVSTGLALGQINRIGRDKVMIKITKEVVELVGKNHTINICPEMYSIWSLHAYFSRYGNVSLDKNELNKHEYFLSLEDCNESNLINNYTRIPSQLKKYKLYRLNTE